MTNATVTDEHRREARNATGRYSDTLSAHELNASVAQVIANAEARGLREAAKLCRNASERIKVEGANHDPPAENSERPGCADTVLLFGAGFFLGTLF